LKVDGRSTVRDTDDAVEFVYLAEDRFCCSVVVNMANIHALMEG
jgi:hypothetical protein